MNYELLLDELVMTLVKSAGSDLHLVVGINPSIRVDSELIMLLKKDIIRPEDTAELLKLMIGDRLFASFVEKQEIDFPYEHKGGYRMRGNACFEKGFISLTLRLIPKARTISELALPSVLGDIARRKEGFFLVVGPMGHGKSTTLAAMITLMNTEMRRHIMTIEDPIEYLFESDKSIIEQREVGVDTSTFAEALKRTFRQDVDVIMIGEMRDKETMATAVTAAETGHLVLATLHSNSAAQTIDRIIDTFPPEQQQQIRIQLASALVGVLSQRLVPRISGGMVPAVELMLNNPAISNLIREKRTHEIDVVIETGSSDGMIDMDRYLAELVRQGIVLKEVAMQRAKKRQTFERLIS